MDKKEYEDAKSFYDRFHPKFCEGAVNWVGKFEIWLNSKDEVDHE